MHTEDAVNSIGHDKVNYRPFSNVFYNHCFLCAGSCYARESICTECLDDLTFNHTACPACARPDSASRLCACCLYQADPCQSLINKTRALFQYRYPVNRLIQSIKYKQRIDLAHFLGGIMAEVFLNDVASLPECIIPVPLHSSRVTFRGYNQSVELARPISDRLGIMLDNHSCKRTRATRPQTDLPANKRKGNVHNAFSVSAAMPYKHVLIIDDVVTTGSTVNELARILDQAGVEIIEVLVCARAA